MSFAHSGTEEINLYSADKERSNFVDLKHYYVALYIAVKRNSSVSSIIRGFCKTKIAEWNETVIIRN